MARCILRLISVTLVLSALSIGCPAFAQKSGGILRQYIIDSPASMSIHEETTVVAERPMMAVMNNLVMFDQQVPQNSLASIVPDLATDWTWDEDGNRLTFHLRQGVKWHDGSRSPPPTSNALGISYRAKLPKSCASTRARPGTRTSSKWRSMAIARRRLY